MTKTSSRFFATKKKEKNMGFSNLPNSTQEGIVFVFGLAVFCFFVTTLALGGCFIENQYGGGTDIIESAAEDMGAK